jgi:hypothetical protein
MAPITAATFAHAVDAAVKQNDGYGLASHFNLRDAHAASLYQGVPPTEKNLDIVRSNALLQGARWSEKRADLPQMDSMRHLTWTPTLGDYGTRLGLRWRFLTRKLSSH